MFKDMEVHDVVYDEFRNCFSQLVYFDFDTEDEAYEFGSLLESNDAVLADIEELARLAVDEASGNGE